MAHIVVWEWMNDICVCQPYPPNISNDIEIMYDKHKTQPGNSLLLQLGKHDPKLAAYSIVLENGSTFQDGSAGVSRRFVQRSLYPNTHPLAIGYKWVWDENFAVFQEYSADAMEVIEDAYSSRRTNQVDMKKLLQGMPYVIDLQNMVQIRLDTKFERDVRREKIVGSYATVKDSVTQMDVDPSSLGAAGPAGPRRSARIASSASSSSASSSRPSSSTSSTSSGTRTPRVVTKNDLPPPNVPIPNFTKETTEISKEGEDVVSRFSTLQSQFDGTEECCICLETFSTDPSNIIRLNRCEHFYHRACLIDYYNSTVKNGHLQCPACKKMYGEKTGDCPTGVMVYTHTPAQSLPGYEGEGMYRVQYHIKSGRQGPEHPNPGRPYHANGFPREGLLPDGQEGTEVLFLLIEAWRRRLTFTVGQSVTTGSPDSVVWNEIHHKTNIDNAYGHGYPDPKYLANVRAELALQGVEL